MTRIKTPQDLGHAIRSRRKEIGWDQATLAKQIGATRQWVIDIEKGKPRAELELALRALNVLGLTLTADITTDKEAREDTQAPAITQPKFNINDIVEGSKPRVADRLADYASSSLADVLKQSRTRTAAELLKDHASSSLADVLKQSRPKTAAELLREYASSNLADVLKQSRPKTASELLKEYASSSLADVLKQSRPRTAAELLKDNASPDLSRSQKPKAASIGKSASKKKP